jgi:hypothetical protein
LRKGGLQHQEILVMVPTMDTNPAVPLVEGFGGRAAVAERFGISIEAVRLWLKNGIPTDRALDVEEMTRRTKYPITAAAILQYARTQREAA